MQYMQKHTPMSPFMNFSLFHPPKCTVLTVQIVVHDTCTSCSSLESPVCHTSMLHWHACIVFREAHRSKNNILRRWITKLWICHKSLSVVNQRQFVPITLVQWVMMMLQDQLIWNSNTRNRLRLTGRGKKTKAENRQKLREKKEKANSLIWWKTQEEVNCRKEDNRESKRERESSVEATGQHEWASLKVDMKADEPRQPPLTALTKPNGTAGSKRPRHPLSDCCPVQPKRLRVSVAATQLSYAMFSFFLFLICTGLNEND